VHYPFVSLFVQKGVMASRQRLFRPSRYRQVCHSNERFCVRSWPIAGVPAQPTPQRCLFPSWSLFPSSSLLQKPGIGRGMVIYGPRVGERTVDSLKVLPSSGKPTQYVAPGTLCPPCFPRAEMRRSASRGDGSCRNTISIRLPADLHCLRRAT